MIKVRSVSHGEMLDINLVKHPITFLCFILFSNRNIVQHSNPGFISLVFRNVSLTIN